MAKEDPTLLKEWFKYDPSSPSCLTWRKRPPHGRKGAGEPITYCDSYYKVKLFHQWYYCHRIILILHGQEPFDGALADHINRQKLDNRIENLRWLTNAQNTSNQIVRSSGGLKYTRRTYNDRFRAQYRCLLTKRTVTCGTYDTAYEAHIQSITHKLENCWNIAGVE